MDMATALSEIEAWPIDERVEFVQTVWDRIVDSGWQPTLSDPQKAELDRRLAALEADPKNVVTWEEITEHVRRKR
jgi:putative addiction module component (TIGR02574 family)